MILLVTSILISAMSVNLSVGQRSHYLALVVALGYMLLRLSDKEFVTFTTILTLTLLQCWQTEIAKINPGDTQSQKNSFPTCRILVSCHGWRLDLSLHKGSVLEIMSAH